MKDTKNRRTGNLPTSPGARRQAAHKARRESQGFKRTSVWIRQVDYERGINDAQLGSSNASTPPPEGVDRLSWMLGYCAELERAAEARKQFEEARKTAA